MLLGYYIVLVVESITQTILFSHFWTNITLFVLRGNVLLPKSNLKTSVFHWWNCPPTNTHTQREPMIYAVLHLRIVDVDNIFKYCITQFTEHLCTWWNSSSFHLWEYGRNGQPEVGRPGSVSIQKLYQKSARQLETMPGRNLVVHSACWHRQFPRGHHRRCFRFQRSPGRLRR